MIKIYCENGALTKSIKNLCAKKDVTCLYFKFEEKCRKLKESDKPTDPVFSSTKLTWDSTILFNETFPSEKYNQIAEVVGKINLNDCKHIDTAYKEGCRLFITPDKDHIVKNGKVLFEITGIRFFHRDDLESIVDFIDSLKST